MDALTTVLTTWGNALLGTILAIVQPGTWLGWTQELETPEAKESLMRFIFYGASAELFLLVITIFLVVTAVGYWSRGFLWGVVRGTEATLNFIGRVAAWAGLLMVLQQILIVFLQRIFRIGEVSVGPFGLTFTRDLSWYSEELKLYNAAVVCLCVAYTFIQGGHVRVDLVYSAVSHRTKRILDMFGCVFFMFPSLALIWLYAWFFFWRSMVTPTTSASDTLDRMLLKARAARWNIETIAFSPNGFDAYFLFKVLILTFTGTCILQSFVFFWRSWLEAREGELSAGRYHDKDVMGDETAEKAAAIH